MRTCLRKAQFASLRIESSGCTRFLRILSTSARFRAQSRVTNICRLPFFLLLPWPQPSLVCSTSQQCFIPAICSWLWWLNLFVASSYSSSQLRVTKETLTVAWHLIGAISATWWMGDKTFVSWFGYWIVTPLSITMKIIFSTFSFSSQLLSTS